MDTLGTVGGRGRQRRDSGGARALGAMEVVNVELGDRSYPITSGPGVSRIWERVSPRRDVANRVAVVADSTIANISLGDAVASLARGGFDPAVIQIPDGEEHKSSPGWRLSRSPDRRGLDRGGAVIALGGGVVGDLTGFAAATYCAASRVSRCRRRSSPRSTRASAARPASTMPPARICFGPLSSRGSSWRTSTAWYLAAARVRSRGSPE